MPWWARSMHQGTEGRGKPVSKKLTVTINGGTIHIGCLPRRRGHFQWGLGPVTQKERETMPLEITLTTEQEVVVTATPVTPAGHPAQVDGPVQFSVQSGTCTVTPMTDMSAKITSSDALEDSVVLVEADADLGAGVESVKDTVLVHVMHQNASSLGLQAGTPTAKA